MSILLLLVGLALAGFGGERFVRGSVGLATWLRIPAGIVGATVAAFATSSPELTVSVLSALNDRSELAFGDATGSNMVNFGVVLGLAFLAGGVSAQWRDIRRETLSFIAAILLLAVSSVDGRVGRAEATLILVIFLGWLLWVIRDARHERSNIGILGDVSKIRIIVDVVSGITLLIIAGRLIVIVAKELGASLGWSQFIVGSVIVALGTSTPELVTTLIAVRRGHVGVGIGTVLGSNIFNSLFIIGIAGVIEPINIEWKSSAIALFGALVATALIIPRPNRSYSRKLGVGLIALYAIYLGGLLLI